ncbi:MATE family efflux transporter [Acetatifactor aquisgranensis]|uniref:MATE family efflux transporter n=1 Tax=Acetatifactor aquisgranensis TaxID=2941233 RepID=UPI00203F13C8|nr:MATE family efflux transporter [Acetatifactor aquisgranensis]MCI8543340.1 MATE family efflux transporter [Lachnospiraceae bacterium]
MKIQLSDHFDYKKLLRFTFPSIVMMIFTSIYGVVDGFFVSNFVGKTPFAAVNFIFPFLMILGTVGFMFGTGGSALVAITIGSGDGEKAKRLFSLFVYVSIICGFVIGVLGLLAIRPVAVWLGAEGEMLENCVLYGRVVLVALPMLILQYEFQSFFITAEKPQLGLAVTVAAGVTNMVLDALLVGAFKWGLVGAAAATALSQTVGGIIPLIYFGRPNTSLLQLTRTKFDGSAIGKACINGFSELMSNISMSVVGMMYNGQLMKYAGEDGVAAYGVLMYVSMIFLAAFIGYAVGVAPVVGYHYGAGSQEELKGLLKKSLVLIGIFSIGMVVLAEGLARPLSLIFVGYDKELLDMTLRGFLVYSFSFLFAGIAIYGSSFFTALGNGLVSAMISFLRTLVFQVAAVLIFPLIWGLDGIWISTVAAELMAAVVAVLFLIGCRKKYRY